MTKIAILLFIVVSLMVVFSIFPETILALKKEKKNKKIILMDCDGTIFPWNEGADYTARGYFRNLKVIPTMKDLVDILRNDPQYDFFFCTAYPTEWAKEEKWLSLKDAWPDLKKNEVIFVPYGQSKFDFVPGINDPNKTICIIDDHSPNCHDAVARGARAAKAMNGVNGKNGTWKGERLSVYDPAIKNAKIVKTIVL